MSDNEYERFEITDYDLENEFNPNRPRRRLTKNQQIYGIWADDSENEDDDEEELSSRRRGNKKVKDYSAPVNFVAGGIQQSGKPTEEKYEDDDDNQITDEEDDRPSFGGGTAAIEEETSSESEDDVRPVKSGFGSGYGGQKNIQQQQQRQNKSSGLTKGLATWEQHTKGIGAKLLLQMGYEPGKGLGKDLQGISNPVEAHIRKGRGAIGAYGPEKNTTIENQKVKAIVDEDEREAKEFKEKMQLWKKDEKLGKKKNRYYYRSVEEVIEKGKKTNFSGEKFNNKLTNVTVIDMTGPEKRVLSGYHALGQTKISDEDIYDSKPARKCKNFALPELMHNLNLIVNMCEQEIIAIDKTEREANEKQKQFEHEKENLEKIVKLENDHIRTLERALTLIESLTNSQNLTLEKAEKVFIELQTDFATEYKEFGLGDLAAGIIAPLVNMELSGWRPLEQPMNFVERIKKWRTILDMHQSETRNVFDPYSSLIWAGVIPSFRSAATEWNPKSHQQMAALLDAWAPLFPTWILDNVLEQLILPRLHTAVQQWDPLTDTIPIHVWILPWSGILGHKMEEYVYPTIRDKLGNALQAWTPQDRSARAMLTPWKGAFNSSELQTFLLKYIIPKLEITLSEIIINPLQQDLEPWNQVWEWHELISPLVMAQILDKYFFPKWMQTLVIWLNQSPNLDQISRWYTGWKSLLSEEVLQQTAIKEHFRRALEIMQRAVGAAVNTTDNSQIPLPTPQPVPVPLPVPVPVPQPPALMDLQIPPPPQLEFKELVSQRFAERGIIFAPMPGRREFGKQVYRVGKLFCYIDRAVLMVSDGSFSNWVPMSLGVLLERAVTGVIS